MQKWVKSNKTHKYFRTMEWRSGSKSENDTFFIIFNPNRLVRN